MPRIQISQEAARTLKVAAAMCDKRPHAYMEELIFAATRACPQVATTPHGQKSIAAANTELKPEKKKKGTFSEQEIDQIKTWYREKVGPTEIARRMGRHKSSVSYAIEAMKRKGEL